jgi:hypothetical protein
MSRKDISNELIRNVFLAEPRKVSTLKYVPEIPISLDQFHSQGNPSFGSPDHSVRVVKVREPEADHVSGETEQKGPDHHARSHEGRNGKTGDR